MGMLFKNIYEKKKIYILLSFNHNAPSCCKNKLNWQVCMKKFQIEETKNQNHLAQSVSQVLFYQLSEKSKFIHQRTNYGAPH